MTRRNLLIAATALIVLIAVVAAISATRKNPASTAAAGAAVANSTGVPAAGNGAVGTAVGRLALRDIDGRPVSVAATGKPGAVWFFAGWCGECLPVGRTLDAAQRQLGTRVSIVGISADPSDSISQLRSFRTHDGNPSFPFVWNSSGSLGQQYRVSALDTTLIYDARGNIVYRGVSPDLATVRDAFRKAGVA